MTSQISSASSRRMRRNERILQTNRALRLAKRRRGRARQELLDEAVELNISVARSIAHQFHNRGESSDDLDQVAYLGLVKAVNGFFPIAMTRAIDELVARTLGGAPEPGP